MVNGVFSKWISLDSVNLDKIQKWFGYKGYYPSDNRYILGASNRKCIFLTTYG